MRQTCDHCLVKMHRRWKRKHFSNVVKDLLTTKNRAIEPIRKKGLSFRRLSDQISQSYKHAKVAQHRGRNIPAVLTGPVNFDDLTQLDRMQTPDTLHDPLWQNCDYLHIVSVREVVMRLGPNLLTDQLKKNKNVRFANRECLNVLRWLRIPVSPTGFVHYKDVLAALLRRHFCKQEAHTHTEVQIDQPEATFEEVRSFNEFAGVGVQYTADEVFSAILVQDAYWARKRARFLGSGKHNHGE